MRGEGLVHAVVTILIMLVRDGILVQVVRNDVNSVTVFPLYFTRRY